MKKIKLLLIIVLSFLTSQLQAQDGYTYTLVNNGAYNYSISAVPNTSVSNFETLVQGYGFTVIVPDGVTLSITSSLGSSATPTFFDGTAVSMPTIDGYLITEILGSLATLPAPSTGTITSMVTIQVNGSPSTGSMYILANDSPLATTITPLKSFMQADMIDNGMTEFTNAVDPNASGVTTPFSVSFQSGISYDASAYCVDAADPTPTVVGGGGGMFSSGGGLSINASTGEIDVSTSTPGTYTVTYNPGGSTASITINALDDASFNYSSNSYNTNELDPSPTITGVSGGTFSSSVGLSINSGTGVIDVSNSTLGAYTITYSTSGTCVNTSSVLITINQSTGIPDFSPIIFTGNTTVIGATGVVDFRVLIGEFIDENSNGITTVELRIPKNSQLTITFDPNLTALNGFTVANSDWLYDGTNPVLHKWTYIANGGNFLGATGQFLGINAIYNSPSNSKGSFPLKTTIKYSSGGETNNSNNDDIDYIAFFNVNL